MKRHLSLICLGILVLLAILGPGIFGLEDGQKAPPYSKPIWLDHAIGGVAVLGIDAGDGPESASAQLMWNYKAPTRISITGRMDGGRLEWRTPDGTFPLASGAGELDLDARDISFKRALGFSPFDDVTRALFPSQGEYVLSLSGGNGSVEMRVEGGRWGWLGTDQRGRDVATLLIRGIRVSLLVGIAATLISTVLGMSLGLLSGYAGGLTDALIMRIVDVLLSIPTLPILMIFAGIWGKGLWNLVVILSVFSWMGTARTVRSMAMSLRDAPWVEGLRALGAKRNYIIFRHLVPETMPLLLANVALGVPGAILAEAGLAFLGLSDPRVQSWGRMLHEAHTFGAFTNGAWWTILPPGIGISLICLVFMDIGRRLEERADPRLSAKIEQEVKI
jgi:peptide/nickel transport system permease protein